MSSQDTLHRQDSTMTNRSADHEDIYEQGVASDGHNGLFNFLDAAVKYQNALGVHDEEVLYDEPLESKDGLGDGLEDASTRLAASRLAKLVVNSYNPGSATGLNEDGEIATPADSTPPLTDDDSSIDEDLKRKDSLEPMDIVELLIQDFGPINHTDGQEETMISDVDAAFFHDVVIIGVAHLTTHRLTFHASLESAEPSAVMESAKIFKSGPVTVHRSRFHRKRRIWFELSHEMLSCYPDATDEGRLRPIRTTLLSAVKKVHPYDPKRENEFAISYVVSDEIQTARMEVGTEEAARSWIKQLNAAIYLHRHRLKNFSEPGSPGGAAEKPGVRASIPLHRISSVSLEPWLSTFFQIVAINIDDPGLHNQSDDTGTQPHAFRLALVEGGPTFAKQLEDAVKAAKKTSIPSQRSEVIMDFGPLTFVESEVGTITKDDEDLEGQALVERRIRRAFALEDDLEIWITRARFTRTICCGGFLALSEKFVCFWSKSLGSEDTKYRIPTSSVRSAKPEHITGVGIYGMKLGIKGHKDLHFKFLKKEIRDEVIQRIGALAGADLVLSPRDSNESGTSTPNPSSLTKLVPNRALTVDSAISSLAISESPSRASSLSETLSPVSRTFSYIRAHPLPLEMIPHIPVPLNYPKGGRLDSTHIVCLTIGSRGDVQPYIALAKGLQKRGHTVTIVTHEEYKEWVTGWGIQHRTAGGDPAALLKLSVEHKMFSPQFFKESLGKFRQWLDDLLEDSWKQCQDAEVLIESPSAMAGLHIAEALKIPYIRAFTMPWTRTHEYAHAFLSPPVEVSGSFNYSTYVLFDNIFWTAMSGQVNRWRRKSLKIEATDLARMQQSKIPFIYNFSPAVVPKPLDWTDLISISGYWFLDNPDLGWTAPESLLKFMEKAREDGKPIVYIGFGSIVVPNPRAMTRSIIKAVLKSDVRAIVSKGWSARLSTDTEPEIEMPPECYSVDKIPHDWLFPQIDAACHHGGAGTTGASLRAGIPTLIKPWFGDQFFWASRVQKLGAGLRVASLSSSDLAECFTKATTDLVMKEKAAGVGERIREEDGVSKAIDALYTYIPRVSKDRFTKGAGPVGGNGAHG